MINEIRNCKKHGLTKFFKNSEGYFKCRKCTSNSITKRRRKIKEAAFFS